LSGYDETGRGTLCVNMRVSLRCVVLLMKQSESLPLVSAPRRRGWLDVLLLRPLGGSPHTALLITRRGRLVNMIPAGGARVLSDYLDLPCDVIEVDGRERHLPLEFLLDSFDVGHSFRATLQLAYQVAQPERVALEVDDALGELTQAIQAALSNTARVLTLDQSGLLKASIDELFQRGTPLVVRAQALGLSLKRVDVKAEPATADRAFLEELQALQREHALTWRFFAESLDPRVTFDVQVGGFYRSRIRVTTAARLDEIEFALREALERVIKRVAVEYVPQEFREAARAMGAALRESPVLQAELAMIQVELLRPAVEIQPARPMLADTMRARLALPAPAPAEAGDHADWMLPPIVQPASVPLTPAPTAPVSMPFTTPARPPIITPSPPLEPADDEALWADDDIPSVPENDLDLAIPEESIPEWLVDRAIFGAILPDPDSEEHIPVWLRGWDGMSPPPIDRLSSHAPDDETLAQASTLPDLLPPVTEAELASAPSPWVPHALPAPVKDDADALSDPSSPGAMELEGDADKPGIEEEPAEELSLSWLPDSAQPPEAPQPEQASTSHALVPYTNGAALSAPDLTAQVARWIRLLRSDGDEEFERLATVIVEQPDRLPAVLSGLIRDPQMLAGSDDPILQVALADELALDVRPAAPPDWLRDEPPASPPALHGHSELPEWLRMK
jgi:hypothetical protein